MRYGRIWLTLAALAAVHAPLALAQSGVGGAWTMTLQTDQGNVDTDLTLKQEGQKVTGMLTSPQGEVPLEGTIANDQIKFTVTVDAQGQSFTMTFNGALSGDSLKGDVDFGGFGTATWTASRKK